MRKWMQFALAAALAMVSAGQTTLPDAGRLTAKATVLRLSNSVTLDARDVAKWFPDSMRTVRNQGSTTLTLLVEFSLPVGSVRDEVAITAITDDRGHSLAGANATLARVDSFPDQSPALSKDHKAVMVDVTLKEPPGSAVRQLTIKGRLSVAREGPSQTTQVDKVPLEIGQEFKAGEVTLRVVRLAMDEGGKVLIGLRTAAGAVKDIEFVDGNGTALARTRDPQDARLSAMAQRTGGQAADEVMNFVVGPGVGDAVTLRITRAAEAKSMDVPFETATGVGL